MTRVIIKTKKEALNYLKCLQEDFTMLRDGDWVPDEDSIDASLDVVEGLSTYLRGRTGL